MNNVETFKNVELSENNKNVFSFFTVASFFLNLNFDNINNIIFVDKHCNEIFRFKFSLFPSNTKGGFERRLDIKEDEYKTIIEKYFLWKVLRWQLDLKKNECSNDIEEINILVCIEK